MPDESWDEMRLLLKDFMIPAVTGIEVPSGKLPVSVGVVVQNVGSVAAIAEVFETAPRGHKEFYL